ncbi:MAG: FkbM family methyltransferase [Bacteroidota bacterium]
MNFALFKFTLDTLNGLGLAKYRLVKPLQRVAPKAWPEKVVSRRGVRWKLWNSTDHVSRALMYYGVYEPASTAILPRFVKQGDYCLDIGANAGYFSVQMGKLIGPKGKIMGFEPSPDFYDRLQTHIELNQISDRIKTIRAGLSDEPGTLTLVQAGCNASFYQGALVTDNEENAKLPRHESPILVLDEYWKELGWDKLDFVKLDVEGFEANVLAGGQKVFSTYKPSFLIEFNRELYENIGSSFDHVLDHLESWGYDAFWIDDQPNKKMSMAQLRKSLETAPFCNIICSHTS